MTKTTKTAAKKPAAKAAAKKTVKPKDLLGDAVQEKAPAAKKSANKTPATKKPATKKASRQKAVSDPKGLYLDLDSYKKSIDGLMAQGLDHPDAVATLKVGLRQANGKPVPLEMLMDVAPSAPAPQPAVTH